GGISRCIHVYPPNKVFISSVRASAKTIEPETGGCRLADGLSNAHARPQKKKILLNLNIYYYLFHTVTQLKKKARDSPALEKKSKKQSQGERPLS
ncbi:MAG: hypothetical protein PHI06_06080, partial [Desulfobulbaceae bacterium]|nr:hypothetical protein [Desulfobulbaceae bacterium]